MKFLETNITTMPKTWHRIQEILKYNQGQYLNFMSTLDYHGRNVLVDILELSNIADSINYMDYKINVNKRVMEINNLVGIAGMLNGKPVDLFPGTETIILSAPASTKTIRFLKHNNSELKYPNFAELHFNEPVFIELNTGKFLLDFYKFHKKGISARDYVFKHVLPALIESFIELTLLNKLLLKDGETEGGELNLYFNSVNREVHQGIRNIRKLLQKNSANIHNYVRSVSLVSNTIEDYLSYNETRYRPLNVARYMATSFYITSILKSLDILGFMGSSTFTKDYKMLGEGFIRDNSILHFNGLSLEYKNELEKYIEIL